MFIVDDEQRRRRPATAMRPEGFRGGLGPSAALPLLADEHRIDCVAARLVDEHGFLIPEDDVQRARLAGSIH